MPRETSILNILAKATDKTTGAALSDAQIVAQAQVRAGLLLEHMGYPLPYVLWNIMMATSCLLPRGSCGCGR